jgi:ATP-binding cassette subfamily B multidrug efflux pump
MQPLIKITHFLRPFRLPLLGALITLLGVTIAQLAVPSIIRNVIDTGLLKGEVSHMFQAGLVILVIGAARSILSAFQRYLSETVSMRFAYNLRNRLFEHIQNLSFSFHDHAQTGQLMSRCTEDIRSMQAFIGSGIVELLQVILLMVGSFILMLGESPLLTLIAVLPLIPLLILTANFGGRMSKLFYNIDRALGDLSARLQENVIGVQVVRAFSQEGHEINRFDHSNRELYDARVYVISEWSKIMPTTMLLVSISTITLLWFGGNMVLDGTLTVGQVVQFNSYMLLIALPARQLTWYVNMASEAAAGAQRTTEVLEQQPRIKNLPGAISANNISGEITFKNVTFTYEGEHTPAIQDIDFSTPTDKIIGLIGHTGSGKTTLVNLIPRFYEPQQGEVLIDGINVNAYDLNSLRRQIGYVLQTTLLFSSSIGENIAFGKPHASQEDIEAAAKVARAHDFIMKFPQGYQTIVGERGITLSGGQRQRIAIARALLIDPRILILDDSTSSVDTETEHLIQKALKELMTNRTTFIIAQRISSIRNADQILVFDQGKIVEQGRHEELVSQNGLYTEIYQLQLSQQEHALPDVPKNEISKGQGDHK